MTSYGLSDVVLHSGGAHMTSRNRMVDIRILPKFINNMVGIKPWLLHAVITRLVSLTEFSSPRPSQSSF